MIGTGTWIRALSCVAFLGATTWAARSSSAVAALSVPILAVAVLAPGLRRTLAGATGRFALGQAAAAAALVLYVGRIDLGIVRESGRFAAVAAFLICMPLYARLMQMAGVDRLLIGMLSGVPPRLRGPAVLAGATTAALGLSFGAVTALGMALPKRSPQGAALLARGVVISMMLAPSTGSAAAVMAVFPHLTLAAILDATAPAAVCAFILGCLMTRGPLSLEALPDPIHLRRRPLAFALMVLAGLLTLGLGLLPAIAWSALAGTGIWAVIHAREGGLESLAQQLSDTADRLASEITLFVATGWMGAAISAAFPAAIPPGLLPEALRPLVPAAIMMAMTLPAAAGIHPMVSFGVLHPLAAAVGSGLPPSAEYVVWIVAFVLSLLVAPVSVLTAFTVAASGLGPWQVSLRLQGPYAAALALCTALYVQLRYG